MLSYAEFPILNPSEQELVIELFDTDYGAQIEHLGEASVALACLDLTGKVSDSWLDVATVDASKGQIRVGLQWVPCQASPAQTRILSEPCSKAIIVIHVNPNSHGGGRNHLHRKVSP